VSELHPGFAPHKAQRRLLRSRKRFIAAAAGVRGGKSYGSAAKFIRRIAEDFNDPSRHDKAVGYGKDRRARLHYWIVAPTHALLSEPKRYFYQVTPPEWIERPINTQGQLWLRGDVLIEFKSADDPTKLVAAGLHGLWVDEAARIKADAWLGQLRQRLSDKHGWGLFSTTPLGRNWFYDEIVKRSETEPEYETIHWTTADNPKIPASEIEAARRQLPKRYFEREYLASFEAFSGNVFDLEPALHFVDRVPHVSAFRRVVAGVDWGWSSPGSIVVVGDTGNDLWILEESYAPNRIIYDPRLNKGTWATEAMRLRDKWRVSMFLCDPSRPDAIADFQRAGLPAYPADNDILFGVQRINEFLHVVDGKPRLFVGPCPDFRREMRNYVWAQSPGRSDFSEVPAPGQSDHALDGGRYGIVELTRYQSDGTVRQRARPIQ